MKHVKHDDKNLSKALKFAKRLYFSMKFCLLVTVALDIFMKEKQILYIFLRFLLYHFSMQKVFTR